MRFDKERWNSMLPYEKLFSVAGVVCFLAFLVFAVLELLYRFGNLSLGFEPTVAVGLLLTAWQVCEMAVNWRKTDELEQKHTLFCYIFILGLIAMVAIVWLFVNL